MSRTFNDLIQLTIKELAQVPGTGTQLYAEDTVAAKLQTTFNMVVGRTVVAASTWSGSNVRWMELSVSSLLRSQASHATKTFARCSEPTRIDRLRLFRRDVNPYLIAGTSPRFIEATVRGNAGKAVAVLSEDRDWHCVRTCP
jgi:hypothetical protein